MIFNGTRKKKILRCDQKRLRRHQLKSGKRCNQRGRLPQEKSRTPRRGEKARDEQKKASLDPELKSLDESSTGKSFSMLPEAQPDEIPGETHLPETPSRRKSRRRQVNPGGNPSPDASKFAIGGLKTGEGELNETTESEEAYSLALN